MSHLITTPFPHLRIRSIVVGHNDISIDAFLTVHADDSEDNWLTEELFSDYVKLYFFVVSDEYSAASDSRLDSYLASPESRINNILENYSTDDTRPDPEYWFRSIANRSIYKELSFSEVMSSFYASSITSSELDGNSGSLKDINFNVKLEDGFNLNNILNHHATMGLKLYAVTHLDVASMISDFSLNDDPASIDEMLKIGGNLAVENILIRNEETTLFSVPETYEILTFADGTPYSGIYHLHTSDDPAPDGFVGFMEGPRTPMHPNARRLYEKSIPYRKVVANFVLDELAIENPFNGAAELGQSLDYDYLTPHTETRSMFDQLYSDTNLFASQLPTFPGGPPNSSTSALNMMRDTNLANIYNSDSIEGLRKRHFDFLNERRDISILMDSYNYIDYMEDDEISHNINFNIDFEKLVRTKSKYAFLIDNLVKAATGPNVPDSQSRVELYDILNLVKIKSAEITRFRLSNEPRSNTPVCTNDFDEFSDNQLEETMAIATETSLGDRLEITFSADDAIGNYNPQQRGNLVPVEQRRARFGERPRISGNNIRRFMFRDYNLAKHVNYGNYAYKLKMHLEDGIKTRLLKLAESLLEGRNRFLQFLTEAQGGTGVPSSPQDRVDFESNYIRGDIQYERYYDHTSAKYSESFKALFDADYKTDISRFISDFITLQIILGSISVESKSKLRKILVVMIYPDRGNYESASNFSTIAERSINSLLKILERDNVSDTSTSTFDSSGNSFRTKISKAPQNAKINVEVFEKRIPGTVKAFVEGDVFYSYGADALERQANAARSLMPEGFQGQSGVFAESIDSHAQDLGVYRILDLDTYIQIPMENRYIVDTNILEIESTPSSETREQANRDLTQHRDNPFEYGIPGFPGADLQDIGIRTPFPNDPSSRPNTTDVTSGLPGPDIGAIIEAGDTQNIHIEMETNLDESILNPAGGARESVGRDLRGELTKEGSPVSSFGKTEATPKVLVPGSAEASFKEINESNLLEASKGSADGTVTIKFEVMSDSTSAGSATAVNNVVTMDASAAGSYAGGFSAGGTNAGAFNAGTNAGAFKAGTTTNNADVLNRTAPAPSSTGNYGRRL